MKYEKFPLFTDSLDKLIEVLGHGAECKNRIILYSNEKMKRK